MLGKNRVSAGFSVLLSIVILLSITSPFVAFAKASELDNSLSKIQEEPDVFNPSSLLVVTKDMDQRSSSPEDVMIKINKMSNVADSRIISQSEVSSGIYKSFSGTLQDYKNEYLSYDHSLYHVLLSSTSKTDLEVAMERIAEIDNVERVMYDSLIPVEESSLGDVVHAENDIIAQTRDSLSSIMPTNDPEFSLQYGLIKTGSAQAWGINQGSMSVKVGVIDTGITTVADLNGHLDASLAKNYVNSHENFLTDNCNHGTKVAGIIGSTCNNSIGVAGAIRNVKIVNIKAGYYDSTLGRGAFPVSAIASALNYADSINLPIVNCSFSGNDTSYYASVVGYSGLIVAAAGNYGSSSMVYPGGYSNYHVITVANTDSNDNLNSSSNYSNVWVDLAAPGTSIRTTSNAGSYVYGSGTSFASPFVSAAAALLLSATPTLTANGLKNYICNNVTPVNGLSGYVRTSGRLNTMAALAASKSLYMGDTDLSGIVTAADARKALRFSAFLETGTYKQYALSDVDYSGTVTASDARAILRMSADL